MNYKVLRELLQGAGIQREQRKAFPTLAVSCPCGVGGFKVRELTEEYRQEPGGELQHQSWSSSMDFAFECVLKIKLITAFSEGLAVSWLCSEEF